MSYVVAVRALCEFTAKQGDLDLRFTPSPTAQEGIAGHAVVTGRRGAGYQTEVSLRGELRHRCTCAAAPTATTRRRTCSRKSRPTAATWRSMPANHRHLHWAQARVYG